MRDILDIIAERLLALVVLSFVVIWVLLYVAALLNYLLSAL